ncbi:MAG: hypothetical protein AUJ98_06135 [Bacteroidetes bacterium CG2_30_33_31]|nr:MAG: hypothetical protein AUJ98_06135 [Bacteroidetes bacterium CG2_30_33_31]
MNLLINETLSELITANIRENKKPGAPCNLFYEDAAPHIEFNGFKCASEYEKYCNINYDKIKATIEKNNIPVPQRILFFKDLRYEIRDFKKRMFPKDDIIFIFERVNPNKTRIPIDTTNDIYKKKF